MRIKLPRGHLLGTQTFAALVGAYKLVQEILQINDRCVVVACCLIQLSGIMAHVHPLHLAIEDFIELLLHELEHQALQRACTLPVKQPSVCSASGMLIY